MGVFFGGYKEEDGALKKWGHSGKFSKLAFIVMTKRLCPKQTLYAYYDEDLVTCGKALGVHDYVI